MNILELILIGVGLSMDAFAVAICKGLAFKSIHIKKTLIIATYFGTFQALMPFIGFHLGSHFQSIVTDISHVIAFLMLIFIGGKMVRDSFQSSSSENDENTDLKNMLFLALATSLDALAVGFTFAFLHVNILSAIMIIGIITFLLSALGVVVGNKFGNHFHQKAELIGGILLIFIGIKILLEHFAILF